MHESKSNPTQLSTSNPLHNSSHSRQDITSDGHKETAPIHSFSPTIQFQLMQQTMGNQAVVQYYKQKSEMQVKQLKAFENFNHAKKQNDNERVSTLPARLQSRIEQLTGMSLNDVSVHYNSNKSNEIGAHAYAQGSDIHLAPGQEKHLPHEAWHVVQQRQGRVQPTMQMKDIAINDNSLLEQEATRMGEVVSGNASIDDNERDYLFTKDMHDKRDVPIVQRYKITNNYSSMNKSRTGEWLLPLFDESYNEEEDEDYELEIEPNSDIYEDEEYEDEGDQSEHVDFEMKDDDLATTNEAGKQTQDSNENFTDLKTAIQMYSLLMNIGKKVDEARKRALNWEYFKNDENKYLVNWYNAASEYASNPDKIPKFLYARFGYAVETLACKAIGNADENFIINYQVTSGHTRPDIVVSSKNDKKKRVLGWIDLTSEKSIGHIKYKDGGGWKSYPYVYEVLYKELNPTEILSKNKNPFYKDYGQYMNDYYSMMHDKENDVQSKLSKGLDTFVMSEEFYEKTKANRRKKRGLVKDFIPDLYHSVIIDSLMKQSEQELDDFSEDRQINKKKRARDENVINNEYDNEADNEDEKDSLPSARKKSRTEKYQDDSYTKKLEIENSWSVKSYKSVKGAVEQLGGNTTDLGLKKDPTTVLSIRADIQKLVKITQLEELKKYNLDQLNKKLLELETHPVLQDDQTHEQIPKIIREFVKNVDKNLGNDIFGLDIISDESKYDVYQKKMEEKVRFSILIINSLDALNELQNKGLEINKVGSKNTTVYDQKCKKLIKQFPSKLTELQYQDILTWLDQAITVLSDKKEKNNK